MVETAYAPSSGATHDDAPGHRVDTCAETPPEGPRPALERIEAALARLQAAATRRLAAEQDLLVRHDALRASVTETLGELDTLIARTAP